MVERCVRDAEAASSSLVTSTKSRLTAYAVGRDFFDICVARLEKNGFAKQNCNLPVDGCKVRVRADESRTSTGSSELVSVYFIVPTPKPPITQRVFYLSKESTVWHPLYFLFYKFKNIVINLVH